MHQIHKFSVKFSGLGQFNKPLSQITSSSFHQRRHRSSTQNAPSTPSATGTPAESTVRPAAVRQNFDEMIMSRRQEAQQSVLVQVNSEKSFPELHSYCSQFGQIKGAHHYTEDDLHYILLEYDTAQAARSVIQTGIHNKNNDAIAVHSPFLWFRAGPKIKLAPDNVPIAAQTLNIVDGTRPTSDDRLTQLLQGAESLDDQLVIAHRATALTDIGTRLRFLAARQIEDALAGMFPDAKAYPFGSSVNGFGKQGCDLDLILQLSDLHSQENDPGKRLVFHTKGNISNGRSQNQRHMEILSDMMQLFMPGICQVRRILQARVPIIKYHHEHMDLEVDLSMSNMTGVYMSELLYMYGEIDERVRPLVFAVRRWAASVGLTNPSPGRWISNFSLTCLVIFYLQQLSPPILPPHNLLIRQARPEYDTRITQDSIDCTFVRDLNAVQFDSSLNHTALQDLLAEFFEFYSQMNFGEQAISLNEGCAVLKRDHSAMYIVNPLEPELNVSKNVSPEECDRLKIEVRNAAWLLESNGKREKPDKPWGLLDLMKMHKRPTIRPSMFFKSRMVDVSELFEGTIESNEEAPAKFEFRNESVKKQVKQIRKKGRDDVQSMSDNMLKAENRATKR